MNLSITIPTSLNEITLEQYQKYLSIAKDNQDSMFLNHKMIEIFCGVSLLEVSLMKMKDINDILLRLEETFKQGTDKLIRTFKHNGVEYGFIPNLDEITLGEYTDLDTYISDWDNMHRAMAVLYRPIKNKLSNNYTIVEYNGSQERCELMKTMPLDVALSSTVFFFNLLAELLTYTANYLETDKTVQDLLKKHNLEQNGDGIQAITHLLKETSLSLKTSLN
jgi:hypothetical protein